MGLRVCAFAMRLRKLHYQIFRFQRKCLMPPLVIRICRSLSVFVTRRDFMSNELSKSVWMELRVCLNRQVSTNTMEQHFSKKTKMQICMMASSVLQCCIIVVSCYICMVGWSRAIQTVIRLMCFPLQSTMHHSATTTAIEGESSW